MRIHPGPGINLLEVFSAYLGQAVSSRTLPQFTSPAIYFVHRLKEGAGAERHSRRDLYHRHGQRFDGARRGGVRHAEKRDREWPL